MAQFEVPQFIEVEERLIGPVTLRQFIYLAAGGGVCFLLFFILALWFWAVIAVLIMAAASAFAFLKINGQSMNRLGLAAFFFIWNPRMYLWKREREEKIYEIPEFRRPREFKLPKPTIPKISFPSKEDLKSWAPKLPHFPKRNQIAPKETPLSAKQPEPAAVSPAESPAASRVEPFILYQQEKEVFLEEKGLENVKGGGGLKSIWQKILTARGPIPKRERPLAPAWQRNKERFVVFQKITGEREMAKRIDYR